ncbi:MAG TPA: FHA domain-containing protein [Fimbriimonadaceae bacterium]|nr:FHA domain-containing protein [Fimbriimonadaceae bacterium]
MRSQFVAGRLALICAILGLVAAIVSVPFLPRHLSEPEARIGVEVLYSPIQYALFGLLVCGTIAMVVSDRAANPERALLSGVIGGLLGGLLVCLAGAGFYAIAQRLGTESFDHYVSPLVWDVLVCSATALAIGISTQPRTRLARIGAVALAGIVASHVIHRIVMYLSFLLLVGSVVSTGSRASDSYRLHGRDGLAKSADSADMRPVSLPLLLGAFAGLGAAMGFCFGLIDLSGRKGWVVVRGRAEGASFVIHDKARIGSAPYVEVQVKGDARVAPVHARFEEIRGDFFIVDLGSPGGVFVDGAKVTRQALKTGSRIKVGSTEIEFWSHPMPVAAYHTGVPIIAVAHSLVDEMGNVTDLSPGTLSIGRDQTCSLTLAYDSLVSRRHAEITLDDAGARLGDLGSRNGTTVNGQRVTGSVVLADGDVIGIGRAKLTYHLR